MPSSRASRCSTARAAAGLLGQLHHVHRDDQRGLVADQRLPVSSMILPRTGGTITFLVWSCRGQADVRRAGHDLQVPEPPGRARPAARPRSRTARSGAAAPPGSSAPPPGPLPRQEPGGWPPGPQTGSSRRHLLKPSWRAGTRPPKPNRRGARTRPLKPRPGTAPGQSSASGRAEPAGRHPADAQPAQRAGRAEHPGRAAAAASAPGPTGRAREAGPGSPGAGPSRCSAPGRTGRAGAQGRGRPEAGQTRCSAPGRTARAAGSTLRRGGTAAFPPLLKARADSPRGAMVRGCGQGPAGQRRGRPGRGAPGPARVRGRPRAAAGPGSGWPGRCEGLAAERRPAADPPGSVAPLSRSRGAAGPAAARPALPAAPAPASPGPGRSRSGRPETGRIRPRGERTRAGAGAAPASGLSASGCADAAASSTRYTRNGLISTSSRTEAGSTARIAGQVMSGSPSISPAAAYSASPVAAATAATPSGGQRGPGRERPEQPAAVADQAEHQGPAADQRAGGRRDVQRQAGPEPGQQPGGGPAGQPERDGDQQDQVGPARPGTAAGPRRVSWSSSAARTATRPAGAAARQPPQLRRAGPGPVRSRSGSARGRSGGSTLNRGLVRGGATTTPTTPSELKSAYGRTRARSVSAAAAGRAPR